ncbi:MAG: carboxypeptidase regulatory-like domain-containing protein [Candidatus Binatia bacterium]
MRVVRGFSSGLVVLLLTVGAAQAHQGGDPTNSSAIAVGPDSQTVWVVNPDSGTVAEIGANSLSRLGEFAVGRNPRTLALLGSRYVYVAVQDDDRLVRLDQADGNSMLIHQLPYGCAPYGVAVNLDGDRVYVSCERTNVLVVLDPDLRELATIALRWPAPRGIAVSGNDANVYVTHFLTKEPGTTGHVTEIDALNNVVARVFDIPMDTSTCETINSGQGVPNLMSAIALTPPESPPAVANELWVAGTRQNVATKGLFIRSNFFQGLPAAHRFPFPFTSFPDDTDSARRRNITKASFHDVTRAFIARIDLVSGTVKASIDIDETNLPSGLAFSSDGTVVYTVDRTFNSFSLFNTARSGTVLGNPPKFAPGNCSANAFDTQSEAPFIIPPQAQLRAEDPVPLQGGGIALTGLDYDVALNAMRPIADGIGTTPIGVALAPDGRRAYTANFLSRTVTVVNVEPGSFRCKNAPDVPCSSRLDCPAGTAEPGVCGDDQQQQACGSDSDCAPGITCVRSRACLPQVISVIESTDRDPLPPEVLDGKILFSTAARDASIPNDIGEDIPIPPSNFQSPSSPSEPGAVVSTAHDASYVACTSCHADAGNDGRSWDMSQFGSSLRNTIDLRGRASFAPGTCGPTAADSSRIGMPCGFDAACGSGSPLMTCQANPAFVPVNSPAVAAAQERFFNPMGTIHWNADRDEVEDFEFTFRSLMGAGDCDGNEHLPNKCIGALIMRSNTTDPVDANPDLGAPNRAIPGASGIAGIRLTHLADYVYSVAEFVRNPNIGKDGEAISFAARRGRAIFNDPRVGCARCHNGPSRDNQQFTDKRPLSAGAGDFDPAQPASPTNNPFLRHDVGTANIFDRTDPFAIASNTAAGGVFQNAFQPIPASRGPVTAYITPSLVDAWNTAPYLHDGSAATLMDVIRPCSSAFEDCDDPAAGRNIDDQHGRASFLSQEQLADLEAFLKAPHGPVGNGPTEAVLVVTAFNVGAPDFGFTFPIPIAGAKIGVTIDAPSRRVILNGADFPVGTFDTGLAGLVIVDVDDDQFEGTIDAAGNIRIPDIGLSLTVADVPLRYTFTLQTGKAVLENNMITGTRLNAQDGTVKLVDIEIGPPVPILGQPTPTTLELSGTLDTVPLFIARNGVISGVVRDAAGQPLPGVRLALRPTRRRARTDANGAFMFRRLPLHGYVLSASKPGRGRQRTRLVLRAGQPTANVDIQLR